MSLTAAKMQNSLKEQLLQEEIDLKAVGRQLEAVQKAKERASKNTKKVSKQLGKKKD